MPLVRGTTLAGFVVVLHLDFSWCFCNFISTSLPALACPWLQWLPEPFLYPHLHVHVGASHLFQRHRKWHDLLVSFECAMVYTQICSFSGSLLTLNCRRMGVLQEAGAVPGVWKVFGVNRNVDRSDCVFQMLLFCFYPFPLDSLPTSRTFRIYLIQAI